MVASTTAVMDTMNVANVARKTGTKSGAATIQGTVQDASGAAVPAATIRIVNQATNVAVDTTSNQSGFFSAPGLNAGKYTAVFSAPGLKKYEAAITLANGQVLVLNPTLTVGDTSEIVTVTGETIHVAGGNR